MMQTEVIMATYGKVKKTQLINIKTAIISKAKGRNLVLTVSLMWLLTPEASLPIEKELGMFFTQVRLLFGEMKI